MRNECNYREKHKFIRYDIGNCQKCLRIYNFDKEQEIESIKKFAKYIISYYDIDNKQLTTTKLLTATKKFNEKIIIGEEQ